jgi:hypothetical protein
MSKLIWNTREGHPIEIKKMATPHLLATIHMIERNRLNNLLSILGMDNNWNQEVVDYYAKFPEQYEVLCEEAERRLLIRRGTQKEGLVKTRKRQ